MSRQQGKNTVIAKIAQQGKCYTPDYTHKHERYTTPPEKKVVLQQQEVNIPMQMKEKKKIIKNNFMKISEALKEVMKKSPKEMEERLPPPKWKRSKYLLKKTKKKQSNSFKLEN